MYTWLKVTTINASLQRTDTTRTLSRFHTKKSTPLRRSRNHHNFSRIIDNKIRQKAPKLPYRYDTNDIVMNTQNE